MSFHTAHPQVLSGFSTPQIHPLAMPPNLTRGYSPNNYQPAQYTIPERQPHQAPSPRAGGQVPPKLAELLRAQQERQARPQEERPKGVLDSTIEALGTGFGQGAGEGLHKGVGQQMRRSMLDKTLSMISPNMSPLEKAKIVATADPDIQPAVKEYVQELDNQRAQQQQQDQINQIRGGAPQTAPIAGINQLNAGEPAQQERPLTRGQQLQIEKIRSDDPVEKRQIGKEIRALQQDTKAAWSFIAKEDAENQLSIDRTKEMQRLNDSGKLDSPGMAKFVKAFGWSGMMSKESQKYEKLVQEHLRDLKSVFTGAISDRDIEEFLKGIPTLANDEAGREVILDNARSLQEARNIKNQVRKQLLKQYGEAPVDLESQVNELSKPQIDQMATQFKVEDATREQQRRQHELSGVRSGYVALTNPRGELKQVPANLIDQYKKAGWK